MSSEVLFCVASDREIRFSLIGNLGTSSMTTSTTSKEELFSVTEIEISSVVKMESEPGRDNTKDARGKFRFRSHHGRSKFCNELR